MDKYGYNGPEQFRPLSPWAYVGYTLLAAIVVVCALAVGGVGFLQLMSAH